jgi:hypothetical protein
VGINTSVMEQLAGFIFRVESDQLSLTKRRTDIVTIISGISDCNEIALYTCSVVHNQEAVYLLIVWPLNCLYSHMQMNIKNIPRISLYVFRLQGNLLHL